MTNPYVLSIETTCGESFQHGFHLGTQLELAKQLAAERYHARVNNGEPVVTVALLRDNKLVDTYYGDKWHSEV